MNVLLRTRNALDAVLHDVTECTSVDEVLHTAALDYEVRLQELSSQVIIPSGVTRVEYKQMGVVRMDNYAPLGVVGERYTPIQNADAFAPLQYLKDEGFIESFEQAGMVGGGQRAFIVARLSAGMGLTDKHESHLLFMTSHDGSGSYMVRAMAQRLRCMNQIPRLSGQGQRITSIKHTQSATRRVQQVRAQVLNEIKWFDEYAENYERMLHAGTTPATIDQFMSAVVPMAPRTASLRQQRAAETRRHQVINRIYGEANSNIQGTIASLFQGAVEYSDYDARGNNAERILLGRDVRFKHRAWDAALALL